jgi:hypothetical protein
MITTDKIRKLKAGKDFLMGSLILKCIMIAPNIKIDIPVAAGMAKFSNHMDRSISIADNTLSPPTKYIIDSDKPYALNSSFMELAFSALQEVGFPNLKNQTLTILKKTNTFTTMIE